MKTQTAKVRKLKTTETKDFKIAQKKDVEIEAEYQRMYERWEAQHLGYSDIDLHY